MIFNFLKYLQPTHYFALFNKGGYSVFPSPEDLPQDVRSQLDIDRLFTSERSKQYDLSWQAIQKGYIGNAKAMTSFEKLPLEDEYYFIRKYFNPLWSTYILSLRILGLNNPIKEIIAWSKSKNRKKSDYLKTPILYQKWDNYSSNLVKEQPMVTVVIPTLNRYRYLKDVLLDLEKQTYTNFEVITIDQSEPYDSKFYDGFNLDIHVIRQEEKALWLARNTAIKQSKGDLLLLFDDDSRVDANWINEHIKTMDFFKCDMSSGVSISKVGDTIPDNYAFFRVSDQLDTGNVLIKKEVFKAIGLFDRQFEKQRMGDGEFGLRAYLNGFLNISNPKAKRLHLKVGSGGLRDMGSWDAFRTKHIFEPRPIPSVLYLYRNYYGNKSALLTLLKTVPASIMPYRFKGNKKMLVLGVFLSLFLWPLVVFQVMRSWYLASVKLKEGPKIESF